MTAWTFAGPLLLGIALVLVASTLIAGSLARRWAGLAVALAAFLPAWLVPAEHTVVRFLWALIAFCGVMRCTDLMRGRWRLGQRVAHVLSVVDDRRLTRAPPAFDRRALAQAIGWEVVTAPAYVALQARMCREPASAGDWLARWALALVVAYTSTAGAYPFLQFAYRAAGFITPPLHIVPAASRSVQEFWGERWNRTVSLWLGETFFRPLARRRWPLLGTFAAFVASALVHAYLAWVAVGVTMGWWMIAFFVAQAFIILAERALSVRAWAPWAGHAWTVGWMAGLSPLFTEAMVRTIAW